MEICCHFYPPGIGLCLCDGPALQCRFVFTLRNLRSNIFCILGGGRGQSANSSIISDAHSCNSCVSKYFLYNCLLLFSRENIIHVCLCVIKLFIYIIIVHPRSMVKLLNPLSLNLWQLCGHCTSYVYLRFFQI